MPPENYNLTAKKPQEEHIDIAQRFAEEMFDRFNPIEQNQILNSIKHYFIERRQTELKGLQERMSYIENSLNEL